MTSVSRFEWLFMSFAFFVLAPMAVSTAVSAHSKLSEAKLERDAINGSFLTGRFLKGADMKRLAARDGYTWKIEGDEKPFEPRLRKEGGRARRILAGIVGAALLIFSLGIIERIFSMILKANPIKAALIVFAILATVNI